MTESFFLCTWCISGGEQRSTLLQAPPGRRPGCRAFLGPRPPGGPGPAATSVLGQPSGSLLFSNGFAFYNHSLVFCKFFLLRRLLYRCCHLMTQLFFILWGQEAVLGGPGRLFLCLALLSAQGRNGSCSWAGRSSFFSRGPGTTPSVIKNLEKGLLHEGQCPGRGICCLHPGGKHVMWAAAPAGRFRGSRCGHLRPRGEKQLPR